MYIVMLFLYKLKVNHCPFMAIRYPSDHIKIKSRVGEPLVVYTIHDQLWELLGKLLRCNLCYLSSMIRECTV